MCLYACVPGLEHDPEKWIPVFGKDHAPTIRCRARWRFEEKPPRFSAATTETLEVSYRAYAGNDAPGDFDRKSLWHTQFAPAGDPCEPTFPELVRLAFV